MRNTLPLSSFPLHSLIHFERLYHFFLSLVTLLLLLFKTYNLPYSGAMCVQEGIILLIFFIFMRFRINQGIGANKTEDSSRMAWYVLLTAVGCVFGIYYILLQYYVLRIETIMFAVLLSCNGLEFLFGFFAFWQFQSYEKQQ